MEKHGQFFPDDPQSVDELIDSLARRAAAQERMMAGLSPEQRAELADLMAQTMQDMGLASEMAHLQDRKSTRLNSSHANISYAVFCLKKKNTPHSHII